jgi:hypothetical protein
MTFRDAFAVYRGYRVPHLQLIEHRRWWFTFSGALIVLSLIGMIFSGFHFSIDFVAVPSSTTHRRHARVGRPDPDRARRPRAARGDPARRGGEQVSIRTDSLTDVTERDALLTDLAAQAKINPDDINVETIGPTWGQQISGRRSVGCCSCCCSSRSTSRGGSSGRWRRRDVALVHDVVITAACTRCRSRGHARDDHRDPHDPRVLAVRHRGDLRQDQGEHRVRGPDRPLGYVASSTCR